VKKKVAPIVPIAQVSLTATIAHTRWQWRRI